MENDPVIFSFFLIFTSTAILSTIALYTRQPLIITYILAGIILGPYATGLISDTTLIASIGQVGIIFLLFLLGLDMQPSKLVNIFKRALLVGIASCIIFFLAGFGLGLLFDYTVVESLVIGTALMFSSTIIGIKLLPTTVLHHRHTGELVVALLLIQDLVAIIVLLILTGGLLEITNTAKLIRVIIALPLLILASWLIVRFILLKLLEKFDVFHEYIFLVALGWCLGVAEFSHFAGLSMEIGAFIAGISIATSPIALYIANNLKPLRDFFLVLFFFSLGARFNLDMIGLIILPSALIALVVLMLKPVVFRYLLKGASESGSLAWEIGFRLGQISEFSLLIAFIAVGQALISEEVSLLIQATAILTFLISSYIVVFRYPSPIAVSDNLRRD